MRCLLNISNPEEMPNSSIPKNSRPKKFKYLVPSYYKFTNRKFDLNRLQQEVLGLGVKYQNVVESNRELCSNNHELVESVYSHYEQISLTTIGNDKASKPTMEQCQKLGHSAGSNEILTKHKKYFLKTQLREDFPELDERNYNVPSPEYLNSYIKECVESFDYTVMRVRLVKLKAGEKVDWHIDYDPNYAARIIVPIFTNKLVINKTRRRNKVEKIYLEADGHPWFLNTGFSHSVENESNEDRIVLMFSLQAPELLEEIAKNWETQNH